VAGASLSAGCAKLNGNILLRARYGPGRVRAVNSVFTAGTTQLN
jgi:hypothetical protein